MHFRNFPDKCGQGQDKNNSNRIYLGFLVWMDHYNNYCLAFYLVIIGSVCVWDPRQKETPVAQMLPAEGQEGRDCWTVAFGMEVFVTFHSQFCQFLIV